MTRIAFVDAAKAICIFLMVVGHWSHNHLLLTYIYSFHMPALFVVSGYLYRPHSWKKTLLAFSIPVVFFSLVNLMVQLCLGETLFADVTPSKIFFRIFHYRYGLDESLFVGDWFLWSLVGMRLLFGDVPALGILRKYYVPIALLCVAYMTFESRLVPIDTLFRGYLIGRIVPSMVFFCAGLWLRDREWTPRSVPAAGLALLAVAAIVLPVANGPCAIVANDYGWSYALSAVCAIAATLLLFVIADRLPVSEYVETVSKGTLVVLGTHIPILHLLKAVLPEALGFTFPFITIVVCYYIIVLCERYCPVLLGKWR